MPDKFALSIYSDFKNLNHGFLITRDSDLISKFTGGVFSLTWISPGSIPKGLSQT